MLTREKIGALLKIDTKNKKDNRYLRVMSCDNPIKELYVYHLKEIRAEFNEYPNGFEEQIALCIQKFISSIYMYLDGKDVDTHTKKCAIKLTRELIASARTEMFDFYNLIKSVHEVNEYTFNEIYEISSFRLPNYIAILELCGIVDMNEDVFRSKFLARFLNIKDQIRNYRENRMDLHILDGEFTSHLEYLSEQINILKEYEISDEDFLAYVILFDIRHFKHNRRHKVLKI